MTTNNPFPSLHELAPSIPPVTWLWPGWIPRGMITLLCATPGAGKSYLALDLARRLIHGLPWPDGQPSAPDTASAAADAGSAEGRNVIYVDAEAAPQLLNQRALAWGMDRTHLYPLIPRPRDPHTNEAIDLTKVFYQARLLGMVKLLNPALVIVDSLGSAAHGAENRLVAVDALFGFLNDLAARRQCAVLLIHHLRKNAAHRATARGAALTGDEVRGSSHIVSLARSVLSLTETRDPVAVEIGFAPDSVAANSSAPRRLQVMKSNLVANGLGAPPPLGVSLVSPAGSVANDSAVANGNSVAALVYGPPVETHRPRSHLECCARWLLEYLAQAGEPVSPNFIEVHAYRAGYSRTTLFRARDFLGPQIVDTRGRHVVGNRWVLPPWPRPSTRPGAQP